MSTSSTVLGRRWNDLLVLVALAFVLLAGYSAFAWHDSDRVLTVDVSGKLSAAEVSDVTDRSNRLGARGLIMDGAPASGGDDRPAATASADDLTVVLLGDAESTEQDVSTQLASIAEDAGLTGVDAAGRTPVDDAEALIKVKDARVANLPTGIRTAPRYLAWWLHPGLVVLPLTIAGALGVVLARRRWLRVAQVAVFLAFLTVFSPSINAAAALALIAACLALAASAVSGSQAYAGRPPLGPSPAPPVGRPPPPPRRDTEQLDRVRGGGPDLSTSPDALLVIGSPSRVSARVGLAPPHQTHRSILDSRWFRALGVSAAGPRHLFEGEDLEDFHAVHVDAGAPAVMVAIADGTSHASHASSGSRVASESAIAVLRAQPPRIGDELRTVVDAIESANLALADYARGSDRPLGALATTLLVAFGCVVAGQRRVTCARVGDSEAFLIEPSGWRRLFEGDGPSAVRESSTATIPSPQPPIQTVQTPWPDGAVLVLATDGVADPLLADRHAVRDELQTLWTTPPLLEDFTRHVQFSRQGMDDDRTAVAVWPQ